MISAGLKEENDERIESEDIVCLMGTKFQNTRFAYYASFNQSENFYRISENTNGYMPNLLLLPSKEKMEEREKFELIVTPKSSVISIATGNSDFAHLDLSKSYVTDCSQF